ncbi:MAG: helix-hairpin-helix domain-containing protein [Candidatus Eremiobacteraeota bacterium]|nr:helix-hairpin-helix domain-containing protein [Candidatus Eremiobacteraeota bacterium]
MKRTLAVLAGLIIVAILVWRPPAANAPAPVVAQLSQPATKHTRRAGHPVSADSVVYVAGAVLHPGLYHLSSGARADDAVRSAGGFRPDADTAAINLAAHVTDGDEVYVEVLGAPTSRPGRSRTRMKTKKKSVTGIVDLNAATAPQLAMIPGIGTTLAARIVEVRERDGAYETFDELLDVAGMTASRLARAEPYLRI